MIGYYIHHHGRGHLHRALCIAAHASYPVTGLSSLERPPEWTGPWVHLPLDTGATAYEDLEGGGRLHWAPLRHPGYQDRMSRIAEWVAKTRPSLLVSDVSVEVAGLTRLLGVPVVVAAMRGDRFDAAHRFAYDLAQALLAPWPAELAEPGWPDAWRSKAVHTGAFSRHDRRPTDVVRTGTRPRVLVLLGNGGSHIGPRQFDIAQQATPQWEWQVLGGSTAWSDDPWPTLCAADVVVTHAGQNAVAECAAARKPTVVLPQERPFGEQLATGRALTRGRLAVVRESWPAPHEWPGVLAEARRLGGEGWSRWSPGDGAQRAAACLDELVHSARKGSSSCLARQ
ncbi:glycosyltransferase [Streptomyces sp. NPDC096193]|uniref:glycosyltransferase n=1 Tax=Streptomyces sp. NPDC096193 TaxID=3155821 RepID=UPI003327A106